MRSAAPTCVTAASTSARGRWAVQSVHMSLKKILLTIFLAIIACSIKMQLLYPPVAMVVVVGGGGGVILESPCLSVHFSFCPCVHSDMIVIVDWVLKTCCLSIQALCKNFF